MSTQDPSTPPPSLSPGGPAPAGPPPAPTASTEPPVGFPDPPGAEDEADAPKPKVDWGQLLVANKFKVLGLLGVLFLAGMGWWYLSLTNEMASQAPPSAVAAELGTLTVAPKPEAAPDPVEGVEQSLDRDRKEEAPPEGAMLADGSATAPTGETPPTARQRADYRAQMELAARANNTDSVTVTERDPRTGQFVQRREPVRKVAVGTGPVRRSRRSGGQRYIGNQPAQPNYYTGPTNGGFSGVTPANQNNDEQRPERREPPRPKYDADGVPFETNDEINLMIAGLPPEVQATYEKMSGRRYRPLPASARQPGNAAQNRRAEMAYIPGMDGFNTIRYRGPGQGPQEEEEATIPDIFYRCSVQGNQVVKTGTVVVLRLAEDATFNGITFPRNMLFSALASVDANRVSLIIDRLGPHRVKVQTFNYAYMPGIMIDPGKRAPVQGGESFTGSMQQSGTQELSNAIAQSQQAANSLTGIAGRMGVTLLGRIPRSGQKLRTVALPDGYPLLLSKSQSGQGGAGGLRQAGVMAPAGIMGQEGNPFQSLLMSGQGQGGYQGNQGVVPPLYYPVPRPAGRQ